MIDHFRILTINTGSSSLKAAVYDVDHAPEMTLSARVQRIGLSGGRICLADAAGTTVLDEDRDFPDHRSALLALLGTLRETGHDRSLTAVGHRVVHGGRSYSEPQVVTDELMAALQHLIPIDPDHLPQAIAAIETISASYPTIPQIACFDTAFHRHMPQVAQIYALPRQFEAAGIIRYGFHGLSYESIMAQLSALDPAAANGRVVIAHLGNGASMAAVRHGRGIETTMGFTPAGGLVMGTRTGDLDPGVVLHLLRSSNVDAVSDLVNKQAGLLGVSGLSADMHDLLANEASDRRASEAVTLFCYQARKFLGALAAALGGLDTLVFTAGIGENAPPVRERICAGLEFLGIQIDPARNQENQAIISPDDGAVTVRVMQTEEDLMIARHTARLIRERGDIGVSV